MMLNLSEYSLLLGADSACAALAIRIHMRDEGLKWQLPLAFAVSDGLGSFLGPIARAGQSFGPNVAQTITLTAYVVAIGTFLIIPKWPPGRHTAWLWRMIVLIGIPVLLSTDNFFAAKAFPPGGTLGIVAAMTAISSYVMSFLGLAVGNAMRMHVGRFGWRALASVVLFAIAWVIG